MCSAIWYVLIAQLTNPFLVPVEEIIAIFCEARGYLAKTIGRPFCVGHMTYRVIFLAPQALNSSALVPESSTVCAVLLLVLGEFMNHGAVCSMWM